MPLETNLTYLTEMELQLSASEKESFINYLIGALSGKMSAEDWRKAIALASYLATRGRP